MKKKFEMPVVSVSRFDSENVVTYASGGNVNRMKESMQKAGYNNVTTFDLNGVF